MWTIVIILFELFHLGLHRKFLHVKGVKRQAALGGFESSLGHWWGKLGKSVAELGGLGAITVNREDAFLSS